MSTICDNLRKSIIKAAMNGDLSASKEGWNESKLEELCVEITTGGAAPQGKNDFCDDGPCFVRVADMGKLGANKKLNDTRDHLTNSGVGKLKLFPTGTVLFTKSGASLLLNQRAILKKPMYVVSHIGCAIPNDAITSDFLYLILKSIDFNEYAHATSLPSLKITDLKNVKVSYPSIEQQKQIVEKVDELMARVADLEQSAGTLASLKKAFPDSIKASLLQAAMQGKLTKQLPGDGDMNETFRSYSFDEISIKYGLKMDSMDFKIPNTWAMAAMDELFNFVDYRGKTPHKIKDGKIFLITSSNIKNGFMDYTRKEYISETEYAERQTRGITHRGDLLFTTEAPMGNAAICDLEVCSCGQRIITFQEKEKNTVMPELFMYFILSPSFQKQLEDNCTGTTAKGIKGAKLKHFLIPVPPLAEQRRIVERLERLIQNINMVGDLIASE